MDRKSRDIFYGVVLVATLLIAIVGATMAYFSWYASSNEDAVKAHAATISIVYNDGMQVTAQADELIPSSFDVVKKVYQAKIANRTDDSAGNECKDDNDMQVCSVYRFSVKSDMNRDLYAILNTEFNEFTYLVYAVRDVNNGTWMNLGNGNYFMSLAKCDNTNVNTSDDCYRNKDGEKVYNTNPKAVNSIFGYKTDNSIKSELISSNERAFDLVLFINENNKLQNADAAKQYLGTITVEATNDIDRIVAG